MIDPLEILFARYQVQTELYDRRLPGGWSRHEPECWIPGTDWARQAMLKNAREQYDRLREQIRGYPTERIRAAKRYVERLPFAEQEKLANESLGNGDTGFSMA